MIDSGSKGDDRYYMLGVGGWQYVWVQRVVVLLGSEGRVRSGFGGGAVVHMFGFAGLRYVRFGG